MKLVSPAPEDAKLEKQFSDISWFISRLAALRFARPFAFLFAILGTSAFANFPSDLETIDRIDLAHFAYYGNGAAENCAFALVEATPEYQKYLVGQTTMHFGLSQGVTAENRAILVADGERVLSTNVSEAASRMIDDLGHGSDDTTMSMVADAMEDTANGIDADALRSYPPLLRPKYVPAATIPGGEPLPSFVGGTLVRQPESDDTILSRYRHFSNRLKIQPLPPFLLSRGTIRMGMFSNLQYGNPGGPVRFPVDMNDSWTHSESVFFRRGVFWGAQISAKELADYGDELLAANTLTHLTIRTTPREFLDLVQSPVLARLTSLSIEFVDAPGVYDWRQVLRNRNFRGFSTGIAAQLAGRFTKLRHLYIETRFGRVQRHAADVFQRPQTIHFLRYFASATHLETFKMSGIAVNETERPACLARLNSLDLTDIVLPLAASRPHDVRTDLQPFFNGINPRIKSIRWHQNGESPAFGDIVGDLFAMGPHFTELETLELMGVFPETNQWHRLAELSYLWRKLITFHYQELYDGDEFALHEQGARLLESTREINRALRHAEALKHLTLLVEFGESAATVLFNGVSARYLNLSLGRARFTRTGMENLAAQPALSETQVLDVRGSDIMGIPALLNPQLRGLKLLHLGEPEGLGEPTARPRAVQRALQAFGARNIEYHFSLQYFDDENEPENE